MCFSPDPNDEFIAKREKIVRNCRGRVLRKRNLLELVSMVDDTCRLFLDPTSKPSALTKSVELEIGKTVPSFRSSEHGLELGMCAAAGGGGLGQSQWERQTLGMLGCRGCDRRIALVWP